MDAFTKIAPHYELLMQGVPYGMWISYLKLIWTKLEVEPQRVLEVACGTGKLCRMLAEEGFEMTGVDISPQMIEAAIQRSAKEGLQIRYETQDASKLNLDTQFDAAFSFFDSLNNILELDDFRSALRHVRNHLAPGSPFLFDLNTAYAFQKKMFDQTNLKPTEELRYKWVGHWDEATRICRIEMDFWHRGEHFTETHVQRAYSEEEVRSAMTDSGFVRVQIFNAYTLESPKKSSDRIHVLGVAAG